MEEKKYLKLGDIDAYLWSYQLSNEIWNKTICGEWFAKKTVGTQFVTASDSISANIAEGFGRYHKKDKIKFYRYSQGSLKECYDWNEKSRKRGLLSDEDYTKILSELKRIESAIRRLIKFTNDKLKY